ncbi:MAG: ABC transporter permease [Saprospiraceae bacterium]|nr:ABC transporter permease [Saprospiraceae bacterium]
MLKNYFKVAWRSLLNQRLNTTINILGLTVGLTSFFLIYLYVHDELSYDRFHQDYDQIYRMSYYRKAENGNIEAFATSGTSWAPRYKEMIPAVEDFVILTHAGYPGYINRENSTDVYMEPDFKWATSNFFEFFHFPLVSGDPELVLEPLNAVLLTETMAKKYFGKENPLGKQLIYNVSGVVANLRVTGVMEDPPSNTHIRPSFIANIQQIHQLYLQAYQYDFLHQPGDAFAFTYLKVRDSSALAVIARDWKDYITQAISGSQTNQADAYHQLKFTSLADMHFEPEMKWEIDSAGNYTNIPIFILVAIMVLLIACLNFMNLATARSAKRAQEIGLRKTLGSNRSQIILQFFSESVLMALCALFLSELLLLLFLPAFNGLSGKSFTIGNLFLFRPLFIIFLTTIITGFIAGSYPAIYLSGFKPINSLRGTFNSGKSAEKIRRSLVIFQFSISSILIICSIIIFRQLKLINSSDLGRDRDRILIIRLGGFGLGNRYEVFRDLVEQDTRFESVTVANHLPRLPHFGLINQTFRFPHRSDESLEFNKFDVDFQFAHTFNLNFIAGRDFDRNISSDSNGIILNETAVKRLNMKPEETIGLTVVGQTYNQQLQRQVDQPGRVIGVVSDFPYKSVSEQIEPLMIWGTPDNVDRILYVKMTAGNFESKIAYLKSKWNEVAPGLPMEHWFMEYEFGRLYENERRMGRIFLLFSLITIFVAILGLYALTSYITEMRRKEIGVRKVLGASLAGLITLLCKQFFVLVLIAFLVSIPVSAFLMNHWLDSFVYRTSITPAIFIVAGVVVTIITFFTVIYDTWKAALSNPIQALRDE